MRLFLCRQDLYTHRASGVQEADNGSRKVMIPFALPLLFPGSTCSTSGGTASCKCPSSPSLTSHLVTGAPPQQTVLFLHQDSNLRALKDVVGFCFCCTSFALKAVPWYNAMFWGIFCWQIKDSTSPPMLPLAETLCAKQANSYSEEVPIPSRCLWPLQVGRSSTVCTSGWLVSRGSVQGLSAGPYSWQPEC